MEVFSGDTLAKTFKGMMQEASFVSYYLSAECDKNATRAYLKLHPRIKYQSAKSSASRLLKKPSVRYMLNRMLEKAGNIGKS
jgi:hypothetical protein